MIKAIISTLFLVGATYLAVMNRDVISVTWSPIHDPYDMPLYAICLGLLVFGYIFGLISMWFKAGSLRKQIRKQKKLIGLLEKELIEHRKKAKEEQGALEHPTPKPTSELEPF